MRTSRRRQGAYESAREAIVDLARRKLAEMAGLVCLASAALLAAALMSWSVHDPSLNHAVTGPVRNWLGSPGAIVADILIQLIGLGSLAVIMPLMIWGFRLAIRRTLDRPLLRTAAWLIGLFAACGAAALLPRPDAWPLPTGLGGALGDMVERVPLAVLGTHALWAKVITFALLGIVAIVALHTSTVATAATLSEADEEDGQRTERDDRDGEPGPALVAVSTLAHAAIHGARRSRDMWRGLREKGLSPAFGHMRDFAMKATAEPAPTVAASHHDPSPDRIVRREPTLTTPAETMPTRPERVDPALVAIGRAAPPAPTTPTITLMPAMPAPPINLPAPVPPRATDTRGYAWAVNALRDAARRRLGTAEPDAAPAPTVASALTRPTAEQRPGERLAIEALQAAARRRLDGQRIEPRFDDDGIEDDDGPTPIAPSAPAMRAAPTAGAAMTVPAATGSAVPSRVGPLPQPVKAGKRESRDAQPDMFRSDGTYEMPPITLLAEPKRNAAVQVSADALEQNARLLEGVLEDFGVRGEIINVRPGPVVTLYELEPAPGTKSSRVIGLADDIARSMSAISARVAVVPGRNAIGIELPNQRREIVYFREMLASEAFERTSQKLALALGKTIGGEPVIAELAKMPHLLVAGTTGSGKSVAINTMILSLLYRMTPEQCRLIMIDPKMLELSIYEGIPHLLTPVVTDPKKAVVALKWAVREMEDRYRKMSRVGVRNIDGFNARIAEARANGETLTRVVETGFDKETGEILREEQAMDLTALPYIIVIIDEMADLMMVAGKEIEGAVQRLAQMARAAGIHVIMATQRPSVDVITGTIKANFPTRISFQVTSKIDSRTILGEMGAEQLLGQGDMLHMAGGGRISRVHGPFVSDEEVERVVTHLKRQGRPQYLDAITAEEEGPGEGGGEGGPVFDKGEFGAEEGLDLYDQAVRIVLRDKKASTSYVQRRLQIGYNRAASIMERMEKEGVVGPANHAGKREILRETVEAEEDI